MSLYLALGFVVGYAFPCLLEEMRRRMDLKEIQTGDDVADPALDSSNESENYCAIDCLGDRTFDIPFVASTTCEDVLEKVAASLGLSKRKNYYALFSYSNGIEVALNGESKISAELRSQKDSDRNFLFKTRLFIDVNPSRLSIAEQDFLFEQAFHDVMTGLYPADPSTMITLAALRAQAVFGDYVPARGFPETPKVHPSFVKQELVIWETSSSNQSKSKGRYTSLGRLHKRAKTSVFTVRLTEALLEEIKSDIISEWSEFSGFSSETARSEYMLIIREWEGYGHNVVPVQQNLNNSWPQDVWLLIGTQGVIVYEANSRKQLCSHDFSEIRRFGAPVANKFMLVLNTGKIYTFNTNAADSVMDLLQHYVVLATCRK